MANEISVQIALSCYKAASMSSTIGRAKQFTATMTGSLKAEDTILVATSATLIPLGQVTSPHWAFFANLDATNFIKIRNGAAGADLVKLMAGKACVFPLYDSAVPYAIADTASCLLEYLVLML